MAKLGMSSPTKAIVLIACKPNSANTRKCWWSSCASCCYCLWIFEKVVTHVDAEIKQCPQCRTRNKGPFPADMAGPVQYGPGIKGYVMNLLIALMISLKRVQQSIQTLTSVSSTS